MYKISIITETTSTFSETLNMQREGRVQLNFFELHVLFSMATLSLAIKFRLLADRLNDNEFKLFVDKLLQKYGRGILLTGLFQGFISVHSANLSEDALPGIISMTEDIITSREDGQESESRPPNLSSLSSALIGEVGSFLHQKG